MTENFRRGATLAAVLMVALGAFSSGTEAQEPAWRSKVDPWVLETAFPGIDTEFLVVLNEQADLSGAAQLAMRADKGRFVFEKLTEVANRTQGPILEELAKLGVEHRAYWIVNMVWVKGDSGAVERLARRSDVARLHANPEVPLLDPYSADPPAIAPKAIGANIDHTGAPAVFWANGFTGQGSVVAGADTGYDWDHPALINQYRGWDGGAADHNYNWHDAIHSGGGVCGADTGEPCDDVNHGTHTMGTMVGDDGGTNQIGMAPGARWIGCRNMNVGNGTPTTYSECFQWFIAPTDLNDENPDPSRAPHVVNNSWSCPPSEGCTDPNVLKTVVENTRAAGIMVVVSAGNGGSGCSSVSTPAAIYDASFSIGATNNSDVIASFSSRGPVTVDGSNRLKPDVSAPGVSVRSCIPGTGYANFSGTSMSGPHVAGLAALIVSAGSCLEGDVDGIENHIIASALGQTTTQSCGGIPGSEVPNNTYGYGAIRAALPTCGEPVTVTFESIAGEDGWVRESGENTDVGGNRAANGPGNLGLRLGDNRRDRQYKTVVSFDTSSIPAGATIQSATLRLRRKVIDGTNPFTSFGSALVDIKTGGFGGNNALQISDFEAAADATAVATMSSPPAFNDYSEGALDGAGLAAINTGGRTQLRVAFTLDDNDNGASDVIGFKGGEAANGPSRPQLVVTYLPYINRAISSRFQAGRGDPPAGLSSSQRSVAAPASSILCTLERSAQGTAWPA